MDTIALSQSPCHLYVVYVSPKRRSIPPFPAALPANSGTGGGISVSFPLIHPGVPAIP